jgi:hypothetical protein
VLQASTGELSEGQRAGVYIGPEALAVGGSTTERPMYCNLAQRAVTTGLLFFVQGVAPAAWRYSRNPSRLIAHWRLRLPDKRESKRSRHRKREITEQ